MTSEGYPNGMTAYYTRNPVGAATTLEYKKETDCTEEKEKCVWFKDSIIPSIHGETLQQASTLSEEPSYTFDPAGRLTQVQEIPLGGGCKARIYAYEEESNRTSLTKREPGSEGKCASEGGTTERHAYDTANQLTDPEVAYDPFGNTTVLPSADAGGSELTSSYYVDNQVYKQTQGGKTIEYKLDPEDRTLETIGTGNIKAVLHYDGPGNAVAWISEAEGKWTRNIPGIGGELTATQTNTTAPVLLLHDLQGDVVAEASISEKETKLLKTYNSTEFGVPTTKEAPPKYAWLGAAGLASELPAGAITQDGVTYVPQTGRPLQGGEIEAPQPINAVTPYVREEDSVEWGAISGALRGAEYWATIHAQEAAADPPGAVPRSECNEEVTDCDSDPEHGDNVAQCKTYVAWGEHQEAPYLRIGERYECKYPNTMEVQLEILEQLPDGRLVAADGGALNEVLHITWDNEKGEWPAEFPSASGHTYYAWGWARYWFGLGGKTLWADATKTEHTRTCANESEPVDPGDGPGIPTPDL